MAKTQPQPPDEGLRETAEIERRTDAQIAADHITISALYVRGWTQREIAQHMNLSDPTISRHITRLKQEWETLPISNLNEHKNRIAAELAQIARTAWEEWERSKKPMVSTTKRALEADDENGEVVGTNPRVVDTKVTTRTGDPRFLKVLRDVKELEMKLLGVAAPTKLEHTGLNGGAINVRNVDEASDQQLLEIIKHGKLARTAD